MEVKKNTIPMFSYHNHTDMSNVRLVDAISTLPGMVNRAIELGLPGIGISEHESLGNFIDI